MADTSFKIYLQSSSKAMAYREKRAEDGNTKTWIPQEQNRAFYIK